MANNGFGKVTDPSVGKATQFPRNDPTKGGRLKTKRLRELIEKMDDDNFQMKIPIERCEIKGDHVLIKIPSKEYIAQNLQSEAAKDVQWFKEWAKVMGEYAPTKTVQTGSMDHTLRELRDMTDDQIKEKLNDIRNKRKQFEEQEDPDDDNNY